MTTEEKESAYLLQLIDCNCNNCKFMERDLATYQKWHDWHKDLEFNQFEKDKAKAILDAKALEDPKARESMLRIANKMRFQFEKYRLINYGDCIKLNKPVSFLANNCQIETQKCFQHRRE